MIDYRSIGRRIAIYRKNFPMTQSTLSEKLGISESYISQIERGSAKVSLPRLYQIADILGVDIALLVTDRATIAPHPVNTEMLEIIKDWPAEHKSFLADLLIFINDRMGKPKQ